MHVERDGYVGIADVGNGADDGRAGRSGVARARHRAAIAPRSSNAWLRARPHLAARFARRRARDAGRRDGTVRVARAACVGAGRRAGRRRRRFLRSVHRRRHLRGAARRRAARRRRSRSASRARDAATRRGARAVRSRAAKGVRRQVDRRTRDRRGRRLRRRSSTARRARLSARKDLADLLIGVTGNFVPAREVIRLGICGVFRQGLSLALSNPSHDRLGHLSQRPRPLRLRRHDRHGARRRRARPRDDGERLLLAQPRAAARAVLRRPRRVDARPAARAIRRRLAASAFSHRSRRHTRGGSPTRTTRALRRHRVFTRRAAASSCSTTRWRTSSADRRTHHDAGDHTMFIARVDRAEPLRRASAALLSRRIRAARAMTENASRLVLTPARRRGVELLDDPRVDPTIRDRVASATSVVRTCGSAVCAPRSPSSAPSSRRASNAIAARRRHRAGRHPGRAPRERARVGRHADDDRRRRSARRCSARRAARMTACVCADALALPFRDRSVDVVMCSQLLHHFDRRRRRAPAARAGSRGAARGHRVRSAAQLARRGGLLARLVSAAFSSRSRGTTASCRCCAASRPASCDVT